MSTPLAGRFQDHYLVLGLEPKADSDTIHHAYSTLAAKYHPNNSSSGDKEKFAAVTLAYEVLADPAARKAFDSVRSGPEQEPAPHFSGQKFFESISQETSRRFTLLSLLYDRRQQRPYSPSLAMRQIEALLTPSPEELSFTIWYLKQRGYVKSDDKSSLQITVDGMDYLEKNLPSLAEVQPFLKLVDATKPESRPSGHVAAPVAAQPVPVAASSPAPAHTPAHPPQSVTTGWKLSTPHRPSVLTKRS